MNEIKIDRGVLELFGREKLKTINFAEKITDIKTAKELTDVIDEIVIGEYVGDCAELTTNIYAAILNHLPIFLAGMPQVLNRKILNNLVEIEEAKEMFKIVRQKRFQSILRTSQITNMLFSHVFQAKQDEYMAALVKSAAREHTSVMLIVGNRHFWPINKHLVENDELDFKKAAKMPTKLFEGLDQKIEKQVIFDVLLEENCWEKETVVESFAFLEEDLDDFEESEINEMADCYRTLKEGYKEAIKDRNCDLPDVKLKGVDLNN